MLHVGLDFGSLESKLLLVLGDLAKQYAAIGSIKLTSNWAALVLGQAVMTIYSARQFSSSVNLNIVYDAIQIRKSLQSIRRANQL